MREHLSPGSKAPQTELAGLDGSRLPVPRQAPLTLLVIYKASCPTCRWALPFIQSLHEKTEGGSLAVCGVAEDDLQTAQAFAEEIGLTFPIASESAPWPVSAAYGLFTVPTLFLIDGESGEILLTSTGFSRDDLREVARRAALLDRGEAVDPFPEGHEIPAFRPG